MTFFLSRFALAAALLFGSACSRGESPAKSSNGGPDPNARFAMAGKAAPSFRLPVLDAESGVPADTISLAEFRGRSVIISVWATWCAACILEHPMLNEVARERPDIQFVGVLWNDQPARVLKYLNDNGSLAFPTVVANSQFARDYLLNGLPHTILIDSAGIIRRVALGGPMKKFVLERLISTELDGTRTPPAPAADAS